MSDVPTRFLPTDSAFEIALADYFQRIDRGEEVEIETLVLAHPGCETELRQFFSKEQCLQRVWQDSDGPGTSLKPQQTIDHFVLERRLGSGAFGTVWKARDSKLNRAVAIKFPRRGVLIGEERDRFLREARTVAQLNHAHIVQIHEIGFIDESPYLVSDLVRGESLAHELAAGRRFTAIEAATLCETLSEALHFAHQAGVVHRDLKPGNILMDGAGQPHLTDFGLAKGDATEATLTMAGQVLGTPAYMSPEQAQGKGHEADSRTDVYSLGVILFELVTGELPFRGNVSMLIKQVIYDDPPSPRKLNAGVPHDLEVITLKCLEKDPHRRYGDALRLAEDLRRFLLGEPIVARPISPMQRSWRWCQRNRQISILAGSLLISLLAVTILTTVMMLSAETEKDRANSAEARIREQLEDMKRSSYLADIQLASHAFESGNMEWMQDLLFRTPSNLRSWEWRWLLTLWRNSQEDAHITASDESISGMSVSPNGARLAACDVKGNITVWDIESQAIVARARPSEHIATTLSVNWQDETIYVGNDVGELWSWEFAAQHEPKIFAQLEGVVTAITRTSDDSLLAAATSHGKLYVWDASTSDVLLSKENLCKGLVYWRYAEDFAYRISGIGAFSLAFSPNGNLLAAGCSDNVVRLISVPSGETFGSMKGHVERDWGGGIFSVAFDQSGSRLASGGRDGQVVVWDTSTMAPVMRLGVDLPVITSIYIDNADKSIITSAGNLVCEWSLQTRQMTSSPLRTGTLVPVIAVDNQSQSLWCASWDGKIRRWPKARSGIKAVLQHRDMVYGIALNEHGSLLASAAADVAVWDTRDFRKIFSFEPAQGRFSSVAFDESSSQLAGCDSLGSVHLWDLAGKKPHRSKKIPGERNGWAVNVALEEDNISVYSTDGVITDFSGSLRVKNQTDPLKPWTQAVLTSDQAVVAVPESRLTVFGSRGVNIFYRNKEYSQRTLSKNVNDNYRTGKIAISKVFDRSVGATQIDSTVRMTRLVGHEEPINDIAFFQDEDRALIASDDGEVWIWDIQSGTPLVKLLSESSAFFTIAVDHFNGKRIYLGGHQGTVVVIEASTLEELNRDPIVARACLRSAERIVEATNSQNSRSICVEALARCSHACAEDSPEVKRARELLELCE